MSKQEWRIFYNLPLEKKLIEFLEENSHMYGAAMRIASNMWREKDPVGAFTVGPCYRQVELYGDYFEAVEERDRLRKELEEARKIKFPRQADGEGGWTIDYKYLEHMEEEISRTSGYASSMEQIQEVLLMVERMLFGQEGEGNQDA